MASTTALFTGLSGLAVNARNLDVIGNNIANVNTTAFKSNRMLFSPIFSRTLSSGTAPAGNSGGTNPSQIGLGVTGCSSERESSRKSGSFVVWSAIFPLTASTFRGKLNWSDHQTAAGRMSPNTLFVKRKGLKNVESFRG